ncbi:hypothetical protein [Pseudomonas sp. VI4.1]|uniref:hypothetical protein n=1 Tax=Pseudomonas sp. VI4.1 TaxID=1941346 RepID=UPI00100822E6|nr:hypothetical protein [Pseudomonas sp. VI4.1]
MTTSDSLPSADGQSSTSSKGSIAYQCRKERELAHAYALEVSAMREALTVQRKLCSTRMRAFRLMLAELDVTTRNNQTRLPGRPNDGA